MTFQVPWVISDVTEVPLEAARLVAYAATGGKQGVVGPGDLLVRALGTPGSSVRIALGAFAALNNYPSNTSQSYMGWNDGEVTKAISSTGGSARSDLIYVRVWDGGQTGGGTSGIATVEVEQDVDPATTTLSQIDANIAGVELARVDMPSSTSTVQQAYITDLRTLVLPRQTQIVRMGNLDTGASLEQLTATSYTLWPSVATFSVTIPPWAIRAQIICNIAGYQIYDPDGGGGNVFGDFRVSLGSLTTSNTVYNMSIPPEGGQTDVGASFVADDIAITDTLRNTVQTLKFEGKRDDGSTNTNLRAIPGTVCVIQVTFYEAPDAAYWD